MKVLITGVAGFIGSNLAERLLKKGYEVIGVDNYITGQERNVQILSTYPGFKFLNHDVINPLKVEDSLDWVMHFASPASPPKYLNNPIETLRVNSEGTYHLLELARAKSAQFFFASTSEVYGDPEVHPQPEIYWGKVNPNGPRSVYDEAKRYGEAVTMAYHRFYKAPIRIIRIFNTYGPHMSLDDGRVVTNFINQCLSGKKITIYGDGKQTRSFQYIDDLVDGIIRLMGVEYFEPINLGNSEEYTMLQLAEMIRGFFSDAAGIEFSPLPQDDPKQRKPDNSLARQLLNWEPRVSVQEGLLKTITYFRQLMSS
jgi:nucleoside-diphosphate-sugar epimerase